MATHLLDTHTMLWFLDDNPKLSDWARGILEDEASDLVVSIVSLWEIAIKANIGKLSIDGDVSQLEADLQQLGISLHPILAQELDQYLKLPLHHRDPFDRLLIAKALTEEISLISADKQFDAYGLQRIW